MILEGLNVLYFPFRVVSPYSKLRQIIRPSARGFRLARALHNDRDESDFIVEHCEVRMADPALLNFDVYLVGCKRAQGKFERLQFAFGFGRS